MGRVHVLQCADIATFRVDGRCNGIAIIGPRQVLVAVVARDSLF
jgi:hypothetical protein